MFCFYSMTDRRAISVYITRELGFRQQIVDNLDIKPGYTKLLDV